MRMPPREPLRGMNGEQTERVVPAEAVHAVVALVEDRGTVVLEDRVDPATMTARAALR